MYGLVSALVILVLASELASGQEVCHWECEVVGCDYYADYCDYDCYEVCFPWARRFGQASMGTNPSRKSYQQPSATKGGRLGQNAVKSNSVRLNHPGKLCSR